MFHVSGISTHGAMRRIKTFNKISFNNTRTRVLSHLKALTACASRSKHDKTLLVF